VVRSAPAAKPKQLTGAQPVVAEHDEVSFAAAMADVRPLRSDSRVDAPAPAAHATRTVIDEETEALVVLSDLVAGNGDFDISDSTEYVEGTVAGFDSRVLKRLRRGEFAYQAMIDLHGMSAAPARAAVERFILHSVAEGHREVLIVHGRGRNSKDNVPVLKERLKSWLARGRIGRSILAFTSARPADGGTGALYVLLRRRRGPKERITVYEGAKRE
jgi:DNA-nicking Smr family endonuclease